MTLEILISTIGDGIFKAEKVILPPIDNIKYLISWQCPTVDLPSSLHRADITIVQMHEKGLSLNRNNAIQYATGDICLIADDDVQYCKENLIKVIEIFNTHPTLQLATFMLTSTEKEKSYPFYSFDLQEMPKGYYVSSIEIAFLRVSIQGKIYFNSLFGIGAPVLGAGEEEVFIYDCVKRKIQGVFFPIEIVHHQGETTGLRNGASSSALMARGAYTYIRFPKTCFLRMIKVSWRLNKKFNINFFHALRYHLKGISYAKENKMR